MKQIVILIGAIFTINCVLAQGISKEYPLLIKKADSLYNAKDYKSSSLAYSNAFKANGWKGLMNDRYNAACAWALAGNADSAFYQLDKVATKMGYDNYSHITTDSDLNPIHQDNRWQPLLAVIKQNKDKAEANLNLPLVHALDTIFVDDQGLRTKADSFRKAYGMQSDLFKQAVKGLGAKDSINLIKVKTILDKYGWLGPDVVGNKGAVTLFLVIQHSDLKTQEKYLPMLREAVKNRKAAGANLALMEDRVLMGNGKKQMYGSQLKQGENGKLQFYPIGDEASVNQRRASVGLEPIENYAKRFGIDYTPAGN